jgi:hypothetical protein
MMTMSHLSVLLKYGGVLETSFGKDYAFPKGAVD